MAIIVLFHAVVMLVAVCIVIYGGISGSGWIKSMFIILFGMLLFLADIYSVITFIDALKR